MYYQSIKKKMYKNLKITSCMAYYLRFNVFQVLLGKLFILFDQDRDELLKQDEWIEFLKGRLT